MNAPVPFPAVPRGRYGLIMLAATLAALGCTALAARGLGGSVEIVQWAVTALGVGSLATFAPALLRGGAETWGLIVLGSGVVRSLVAVGLAYGVTQAHPELASRPLVMSVAAGTLLVLVCETTVSVSILNRLERLRAAQRHAGAASSSAFSSMPVAEQRISAP